jgi:serine phosphatase RsbU (regulator of sigma subunit)
MPGMSYEEKEMVLDTGQGVLFYSDGLVEAHNPEGEMFSFPRLRALIAQHAEEERALRDFLMKELHSFTGVGTGGRHYFGDATEIDPVGSAAFSRATLPRS